MLWSQSTKKYWKGWRRLMIGGWRTPTGCWLTLVRLEQLLLVTSTRTFSREFLPGISGGKTHWVLDLIGPQVPDGDISGLKEAHILLIPEPEHRLPEAEVDVRDLDEEHLPLPPGLPQWGARLSRHWWFPRAKLSLMIPESGTLIKATHKCIPDRQIFFTPSSSDLQSILLMIDWLHTAVITIAKTIVSIPVVFSVTRRSRSDSGHWVTYSALALTWLMSDGT